MPRREKQGDVWHSHSIIDPTTGERLYCRGYPGPSSPGYDLPADAPRPPVEEPEADEELNWSEPPERPPRQREQTLQAQAQQARAATHRPVSAERRPEGTRRWR